jgi:hypothetical protein
MNLSRVVPVGLLAAALLVSVAPAANAATSENEPTVSVVARKLNNPRGIAVGHAGVLYVAEAGKGGQGPCIASPEDPEAELCFGKTSALTAVSAKWHKGKPHWKQKRVVTGLPSIAEPDGSFALGLHDISPTHHGALVGTIGGAGTVEARNQLGSGGRLLGHVVGLWPHHRHDGKVKPIADLNQYEKDHNPDGGEIDSNPYGVLATPHGALATDAGGNDLLAIDKKGKVSTVAVFPTRMVPAPPGIPDLPPQLPMQAVPTTVTKGPDGAYYVGELTGFPFQPGAARIWRVVPGQAPTEYATGFTNIIDIAFDRKGRLLVLQITKNGLLSGEEVGALYRVENGTKTELAAGKLTMPGGVAVGRDGALYVTNKSVSPGGGEVLRIWA